MQHENGRYQSYDVLKKISIRTWDSALFDHESFCSSFGLEYNKNLKIEQSSMRVVLIEPVLFGRKVTDKLEVNIIL